jgi:hypothetical protein
LRQNFIFYYAYSLYKLNFFLKSLNVVQRCRYQLRGLPEPTTNLPLSFSDIRRESEDERLAVLEAQLVNMFHVFIKGKKTHFSFRFFSF